MKPSAAEKVERHCHVLEKVASMYESGSPEYTSLREAALALLFVQTEGHWERFEQVWLDGAKKVEVPTQERDLEIQLIENAMQSLMRRLATLRSL